MRGPFNHWAPCIFYCGFVWSFIFCTSQKNVSKHKVGMQHLKGCFIDNIVNNSTHTREGLKVDCYIKPSCYVMHMFFDEVIKNQPAWPSQIKICLWIKFQPPTRLLAPPGPAFVFWSQINYPCGWCHLKINHPSLHASKKYASGPSFSVLHGSWLCQDPFSRFGH